MTEATALPTEPPAAPPDSTPEAARPWPVVLLSALGAWLAAIPLLGVVALLLGDVISRSAGAYFCGALLLIGAVTVLRSRALPIFAEQLAFPALVVGAGTVSFGLYRDLPKQPASAVLCLLLTGMAWAIARGWLRALLGAGAAVLAAAALLPARIWTLPRWCRCGSRYTAACWPGRPQRGQNRARGMLPISCGPLPPAG